jgi:preprotein translocase subunit SecG
VEDGVPFCKHCGGPQIRVAGFEPQVLTSGQPPGLVQSDPHNFQWSHALSAAATAGLVAAASMLIPAGALGLGIICAGYLSVRLYHRRSQGVALSSGIGARLGALTGLLGFVFFIVLIALEVLVFHSGGELHNALIDVVQQSISRTSDSQARQALEYFKTPAGLAVVMSMGLTLMFLVFLVLSTLGGVLGSAFLGRKPRA